MNAVPARLNAKEGPGEFIQGHLVEPKTRRRNYVGSMYQAYKDQLRSAGVRVAKILSINYSPYDLRGTQTELNRNPPSLPPGTWMNSNHYSRIVSVDLICRQVMYNAEAKGLSLNLPSISSD